MTPLERRAELLKAAALLDIGLVEACRRLGTSHTHMLACLRGDRLPSYELAERVAAFVKLPMKRFWGQTVPTSAERRLARAKRLIAIAADAGGSKTP